MRRSDVFWDDRGNEYEPETAEEKAERMREENAKAEMELRNTLMLMRLFGGWPT